MNIFLQLSYVSTRSEISNENTSSERVETRGRWHRLDTS